MPQNESPLRQCTARAIAVHLARVVPSLSFSMLSTQAGFLSSRQEDPANVTQTSLISKDLVNYCFSMGWRQSCHRLPVRTVCSWNVHTQLLLGAGVLHHRSILQVLRAALEEHGLSPGL